MSKTTFFDQRIKRIEKFSKKEQSDLVFDLINAIALAKDPIDAAMLIQDLLTPSEIKNLSKRLRIVRLLLNEKTDREIVDLMHCSFATITKVKLWFNQTGVGLRKIVKKLPKRRGKFRFQRGYYGYGLPQIVVGTYLNTLEAKERQRVEKFLENLESKKLLLKKVQEAIDEEFQEIASEKRKIRFRTEMMREKMVVNK